MTLNKIAGRAEAAVAAVLPRTVQIQRVQQGKHSVDLEFSGHCVRVEWLGEGGLRQIRELIARQKNRSDVVVARRISPGAKEALSAAGIGWVDETGAAEIVLGTLIVSRSGRRPEPKRTPPHWTPAVLAVAETLLCGSRATVGDIQDASGLSAGSSTNALRTLTDLGLLYASARRGRNSARRISDPDRLLDEYAAAVESTKRPAALAVGVTWRDFVVGLGETGPIWNSAGISWAATGAVAASVVAPYLSTVAAGEVYVDAMTLAGLEWVAATADLRPIDGGRLTLRPFPTVATKLMASEKEGMYVAPWPRVYADLRLVGVRGEEAAEHLRCEISGSSAGPARAASLEPR